MKVNLFVYYLLQWTWGIIQNILGLIITVFLIIVDSKRLRGFFNGAYVSCNVKRWPPCIFLYGGSVCFFACGKRRGVADDFDRSPVQYFFTVPGNRNDPVLVPGETSF